MGSAVHDYVIRSVNESLVGFDSLYKLRSKVEFQFIAELMLVSLKILSLENDI